MYIKTFCLGPLDTNSHLVWTADGAALVVDCGGEPQALLEEIAVRHLHLSAVLLTHLHIDHVLGLPELCRATGAPAFGPLADAFLLGDLRSDVPLADLAPGKRMLLGEPCLILPTPGHTPGHLVFFFPKSLTAFTGDTLFAGSVGRTDGPGGDAAALMRSIRERLLVLPDTVEIFPGHGPSTTIGREKAVNPFLAADAYKP